MTAPFDIVATGSALSGAPAPRTPKNVSHLGGEPNPTAAALAEAFPFALARVTVVWGETTVLLKSAMLLEVMQWLRDDPAQRYDYLWSTGISSSRSKWSGIFGRCRIAAFSGSRSSFQGEAPWR